MKYYAPSTDFESKAALEIKTQILTEAGEHLCPHLDPQNILRKLKYKCVISIGDKEEVDHVVTSSGKVDKILDILSRKPVEAYYKFMEILRKERSDLYQTVKDIENRLIAGTIITGA